MQPRDGSLVPAAMMNCAIWRAMLNVSRQRRYSTPWEYAGRAHFASGAPKSNTELLGQNCLSPIFSKLGENTDGRLWVGLRKIDHVLKRLGRDHS